MICHRGEQKIKKIKKTLDRFLASFCRAAVTAHAGAHLHGLVGRLKYWDHAGAINKLLRETI
jgi:hypothetical protein